MINNNYINYLKSCNFNKTEKFKFKYGITKIAKVLHIYDGNNINIAMSIHPNNNNVSMIYNFDIFMYGYTTEKLINNYKDNNKDNDNDKDKQEWAKYQKIWLQDKLLNKIVLFEFLGYNSDNNIIGKIYLDINKSNCINDNIVKYNIAPIAI